MNMHTRMKLAPAASAIARHATPPLCTRLIPNGSFTPCPTARATTACVAMLSGGRCGPARNGMSHMFSMMSPSTPPSASARASARACSMMVSTP
ncbi:MAG: hypothetical protein QM820_00750 [Minicystis sp.]